MLRLQEEQRPEGPDRSVGRPELFNRVQLLADRELEHGDVAHQAELAGLAQGAHLGGGVKRVRVSVRDAVAM